MASDDVLAALPPDRLGDHVEDVIDATIDRRHIRAVLSTVAAEARREALEEAAALADKIGDEATAVPHTDCQCLRYYCSCPHETAAAIRALKGRA